MPHFRGSVQFLAEHKIDRLGHVVCTHPHDDHSGRLIELLKDKSLKVDRAWMHIPENHVDRNVVDTALSKSVNLREASIMRRSLDDADDLGKFLEGVEHQLANHLRALVLGF